MSLNFFCPTKFEIPKSLSSHTQIFGIGESRSKELSKLLLQMKIENFVVIYGCAGALNPNLKAGEIFLISGIFEDSQFHTISIPEQLAHFPHTKLFTSKFLINSAEEKHDLYKKTGSDLVDMEMLFIWKNISEELQKKIIFVRGISDSSEERLDFLETVNGKIRFSKSTFISLTKMRQLFRFIKNFSLYKKNMEKTLSEISSLLKINK
ncbi:MAG: hypothetical protein J0L93_06665 [Deltaproteobacteria bacterium]|nr:hypothetical protein [Deltaproteobacteria bacterium]